MTSRIPRLAAAVFGVLFALATVNVATARADDDPILSTTCGAGTVEACGEKPIIDCDWIFEIGANGDKTFSFRIGRSNCRIVGKVPIYKDLKSSSVLSGSCNALSPIMGMPIGSGCSEEDEI